ncbi:hypothetical protein EDEG_01785 [Edhazardia aedis USNM 41457]|uniref:MSP domain-containing protein n=1 Tax=Edhazardia aedis (strain USNM 41457) TaxID=1003232 RepID=J9D8U6_EDHAE|nr:hypothetical protein EDEG_01785 [Edhazardia aedis USNM 41457]|eukprot:EJW03929.1 hypothetical protein EDEG_01785 [Edhazardia aedis USNM 41457]
MSDNPSLNDISILPDHIKIDLSTKTGILILKSKTTEGRAFKIKTTRPKDYVVEPSLGIILPFQEFRINIKLTPDSSVLKDTFYQGNMVFTDFSYFLNPSDHRFKLELYKFDWRRNLEELRAFLKEKNPKGIEKKLDVMVVGSKQNVSTMERCVFVDYFTWVFVIVTFLRIVKNILL